ncbi:MAG: DUF6302 family protein [Streptosporangiaceae bacterium]
MADSAPSHTVTDVPPDFAEYAERLAEPELLDDAVIIDGATAVPVGGRRRGSYLSAADPRHALTIFAALSGRDGFPGLRIAWSPHPEAAHTVEWGDPAPDIPDTLIDQWTLSDLIHLDTVRGRFYGYRQEAIDTYLTAQAAAYAEMTDPAAIMASMTFIYDGQRPKILRAQVHGADGYALLPDEDDPEGIILFTSWQNGLTRWVSELTLIVGQTPPAGLPTLKDYLEEA